MRKFSLLLLFLAVILQAEDQNDRTRFLLAYYDGDYENAHSILKDAFPDETIRQVWDERIHAHKNLPCDRPESVPSIKGMALLRIGRLAEAEKAFQEDWLSVLGRGTLAMWKSDFASARRLAGEALALQPERPELLYFAGVVASTPEESTAFFTKFLTIPSEDPLKRTTAEFSIDFNKKTAGMNLNAVSVPASPKELESMFRDGRPLLKAVLNQKEKLTLLVDTGAGGLTLKQEEREPKITSEVVLTGLGKTQATKALQAVFQDLAFTDVQVKNAVASISPTWKSAGIDGITGTILFSDYLILLPVKSGKKMTLFLYEDLEPRQFLEKHGLKFSDAVTVPFQLVNRLIILKGRIKDSPDEMDILLDTGAQQSILSVATAREYARINFDQTFRNRPSLSGLGGKADDVLVAENVDIRIGSMKSDYSRMLALNLAEVSEALELELDLILGRDFLAGYTLFIDYRNRRVTFLR